MLDANTKLAACLCALAMTACLPPLPDKDGETISRDDSADDDDSEMLGASESTSTSTSTTTSTSSSTTTSGSSGDDGSESGTTSAPPLAACGNGILEEGEACDGLDFGGSTCVTSGFAAGDLVCATDCSEILTTYCTTGAGTCCTAHGGLGCDDATIESCACGIDSYCCNTSWDDACVGIAVNECGALC